MFRRVLQIFLIGAIMMSSLAAGADTKLTIQTPRQAYYRGESAVVTVTCTNNNSADLKDAKLKVYISSILKEETNVNVLPGAIVNVTWALGTSNLKKGEYEIKCSLESDGKQIASGSQPLFVAKRPNPDEMMVWLWPHRAFNESVDKFSKKGTEIVDWWASLGLNNFTFSTKENGRQFFDYSLYKGLTAGFEANGALLGIDPKTINDPDAKYLGVYNDNRVVANPFNPEVQKVQNTDNEKMMQVVKVYPNIKTSFYNTEIVDALLYNKNKYGIQLLKDKLGFTEEEIGEAKYIAKGVIDDNDRRYQFKKYTHKIGNGLAAANKQTLDVIHKYRPDIKGINDPYRDYTIFGTTEGVDIIGSWTYTNPDPKFMLFTETLRTIAKADNKDFISTVTLLNYPGTLAPTEDWLMMDAGRLIETSWINLSRAPKILGYYFSSACDPFSPRLDADLSKVNDKVSDFVLPPGTYNALKELSIKVIKPYGGFIKNLETKPRNIAVLSSETSRIYGKSPALLGYYPNLQIYNFYTLLAMNHLQADVLFDESIEQFGLDNYDVLVLPKCDVLTKTVYDKVVKFANSGGLVIADQYLGPDIPGVVKFDFDFLYRDKVTADAIAKNVGYAKWDDHLQPGSAELVEVKGVTALDDQKIMVSYADTLKKGLKGKVKWSVECDKPTVLINELEKDGITYLVLINDNRTYDERLGKYKAVLAKIVPESATVTVNNMDSGAYVYDMLAKKELKAAKKSGAITFNVNLSEIGGTVIALYPEKLKKINIDIPKSLKMGVTGRINVNIAGSKSTSVAGIQPLKLTITDPKGEVNEITDYYLARNGNLNIDFMPAINDKKGNWSIEVEDLTAGLKAKKEFSVD